MRKINLTNEQAEFLELLLEHELDEEFRYQVHGDGDGTHYRQVLDLYKAVLGKGRNFISTFVVEDLIANREEELKEIER